ncbi:MAG TPA: butyrate kinase [Candidatus Kryptonia bacterium]
MPRTREHLIVVVNTGSTSTKLALYKNDALVSAATIVHTPAELEKFGSIWDQFDFRAKIATEWVRALKKTPSAVVGVGGLLKPVAGGTYLVNDSMVQDAKANLQGEHASNLGCAIAQLVAQKFSCHAFVVDPVSVDEFETLARYSGHPLIKRHSLSHALNIHAVARTAAARLRKNLSKTNFIVAHLGGGISVATVVGGRIVDSNDASGEGPFTPERTGSLPLQQFMGVCFSGDFSSHEVRSVVMGKGGLVAYLGTNSGREVEEKIRKKDREAETVYRAMAYQISKEIGAMSTVVNGKLNAIILTGGLAHSRSLVRWIKKRISFIAEVLVYPGGDEMKSMAMGALRVLRGQQEALEY